MKRFKIVHVVRQFSPAIGGLESFVKCLARQQLESGLDVEVVTLNEIFHQKQNKKLDDKETIDGIPVTRIPYKGSYKYPIATRVLKKIDSADLIHVHAVDFFADFLSLTQFIHKKPLVLSTHGGFFHTNSASIAKKLFFNIITRFTIKFYSAVAACSAGDLHLFRKIKKKNLNLVENGVDIEKFSTNSRKSPNKRLVFIGRFSKNKRIDQLLYFFNELVSLDNEYHLLIIGKDWDNTFEQIQQILCDYNLSDHVSVLLDLEDDEIKHHLKGSSFIVSASEYEGFGLSIIEGMSAGLIPICSAIPSFAKITRDAGIGINVDFTDFQRASEVHKFIQVQLDDYDNSCDQARLAASKYGWQAKAKEFVEIYDRVLGNSYKYIQGVKIDTRSGNNVVKHLDNQIRNKEKTLIAFANAHTINTANRDYSFKSNLGAFLVLNDGIGVEIASKLKYGSGFEENLNGTDFMPKYLSNSKQKLKVFLLGASESVVKGTYNTWTQKYIQHEWRGYHHGYFDTDNSVKVIELIKQSGADTLIVAMGNPIQEKWICQNRDQLPVTLAFGVGALFDFVAGEVQRAPHLVRRFRLEWIFRLLQEPKRMWRRYLIGNVVFMKNCLRD